MGFRHASGKSVQAILYRSGFSMPSIIGAAGEKHGVISPEEKKT